MDLDQSQDITVTEDYRMLNSSRVGPFNQKLVGDGGCNTVRASKITYDSTADNFNDFYKQKRAQTRVPKYIGMTLNNLKNGCAQKNFCKIYSDAVRAPKSKYRTQGTAGILRNK